MRTESWEYRTRGWRLFLAAGLAMIVIQEPTWLDQAAHIAFGYAWCYWNLRREDGSVGR